MSVKEPALTRGLILIVEDHPLTMKLFVALAERARYRTLEASNGAIALSLAREHHPDLIIMDIELPDISGLYVTRELKRDDQTRSIPIVITTGFVMRENEARESGCDGFLAKPVATSDFVSAIDTCLANK